MSFAVNVITSKALELFSNASAGNPIVFDGAGVEFYAKTEQKAKERGNYHYRDVLDSYGYQIKSSSSSGLTARIVAEFNPDTILQAFEIEAHSVCIYGRLASQSESEAIPMIYCSDPEKTIIIPTSGSRLNMVIQIAFNITLQNEGSVIVTEGNNASIGDLDRFVSCHKAGDSASGTIRQSEGTKHSSMT